jgi:hypothetical protein
MMRLHCKVISFATAAVLRLITRGLSPAENSTANRVAAPPAKSSAEATPGTPDNRGRNVRDRAANGLTLFSQPSAASDVDLTRRIRRALVKDKYLSTSAKNIKIIAKDGSVTLRAPVRMQQEQTTMAHNARQVAGADRADDQLDILHR